MKKIAVYAVSAAFILALGSGCAGTKKTKKTTADSGKTTASTDTTVSGNTKNYLVRKGDSLWVIAGKNSVLSDSFQWPLLFKSNRDQIEDPDLIEVRQDLNYKETYSREEIREAIGKAKETPAYVPHTKPRRVLPVKY